MTRAKGTPAWAKRARGQWRFTGSERPPFAAEPAAGQESVWDYPRPPCIVDDPREIVVTICGERVVRSHRAVRVLETASPPTFYFPPADVERGSLRAGKGGSRCEWKGEAVYWDYVGAGGPLASVAWSYPEPFGEFEPIRDWLAFYPCEAGRLDGRVEARVAGERVHPQPGSFYGGWITSELVGPFKGEGNSGGW